MPAIGSKIEIEGLNYIVLSKLGNTFDCCEIGPSGIELVDETRRRRCIDLATYPRYAWVDILDQEVGVRWVDSRTITVCNEVPGYEVAHTSTHWLNLYTFIYTRNQMYQVEHITHPYKGEPTKLRVMPFDNHFYEVFGLMKAITYPDRFERRVFTDD